MPDAALDLRFCEHIMVWFRFITSANINISSYIHMKYWYHTNLTAKTFFEMKCVCIFDIYLKFSVHLATKPYDIA